MNITKYAVKVMPGVIIALMFILGTALPSLAPASPTVALNMDRTELPIGSLVTLLEDPSSRLSIDEVQALDAHFTPSLKAVPSFGFSDSAWWARIDLAHNVTQDQLWLLELAYAPLQHIDVFLVDNGKTVSHQVGGSAVAVGNRPFLHRTHVFPLQLSSGENGTLYIRIAGESSLSLPLTLWRADAFARASSQQMTVLGAYIGVMVALMLYNLFIFNAVRDVTYALYVAFLGAFGLFACSVNGIAATYFWPATSTSGTTPIAIFASLATLMGCAFSYSFLQVYSQGKWIKSIMGFAIFLGALNVVVSLTLSYKVAIHLLVVDTCVIIIVLLGTASTMLHRGFTSARYYLLAWIMLLIGVFAYVLKTTGIIPVTLFTEYGIQFGSALEAILLSVALAARMRTLREENAQAQRRILEQEKMANLGLLSAGVAHEINNPNNFVSVSAQTLEARLQEFEIMLADMADEDEDIKQAFRERFAGFYQQLGLVREGSERIKGIVKGMRAASRNDASQEKTSFDPCETLKSTLELVRPTYRQHTSFDTSGLGTQISVEGYPSQLAQVFTNLLVNACHAIEERQKIETHYEGRVFLRSDIDGSQLLIHVTDNGCGMPEDVQKRLFEPFFTTKGADKGTGLGMGICRGIIERHGGKLLVNSTEGEGTTMTVSLPIPT
jgi:signal transduction histidine kinase